MSIARTNKGNPAAVEAGQSTILINGQSFVIRYPATDSIDFIAQEIFVKKVYPYLPFLQARVHTILDIGANIGCATLLFHSLYPSATIFAFEPDAESFSFLQENVGCLARVKVFNQGLYQHDRAMKLFKGLEASATNSVCRSALNSRDYEEVGLRRASSAIADLGVDRIAIMKIDTEGCEVPILRDIEHLLNRIDAIFLEYHSESDRLEIDHLLTNQFVLWNASASHVHRGTVGYVSKSVIASQTNVNKLEIARPSM